MKKLYFNVREKRLFNSFSNKNYYYKDCYLGETKPILDRKIKDLEKKMIHDCKAQLKFLKNKEEIEKLQSFINSFDEPTIVLEKEIVPETKVIEEQLVKKVEVKKKEPFIFKTESYRKDYSRYVYWCNPFEPINKGKLGTTQGWRKEEKFPQYY